MKTRQERNEDKIVTYVLSKNKIISNQCKKWLHKEMLNFGKKYF